MLTLTGDNFLIVRVEECFDFFICSHSSKLHIFSTDLVIEFIARGIEINLLAFSYKKPRGGGDERSRSYNWLERTNSFFVPVCAKLFQSGRSPFSGFR